MEDAQVNPCINEVLLELETRISKAGSAQAYAKSLGVSEGFVSQIRRGHTLPNGKVLKDLGYTRHRTVCVSFQRTK